MSIFSPAGLFRISFLTSTVGEAKRFERRMKRRDIAA
jgi:hypothetical protein